MEDSLKILILCSYYNRPILVRNTLNSILKANEHHTNWELAFGDDGSDIPGKPIVEEILKDHLDKVKFVHSNMKFEDKILQGLILGKLANEAMKESDADVALILCDDDELVAEHLKELSDYFINHPRIMYCYSKIHIFNPFFQKSENVNNLRGKFNKWKGKIVPFGKVDATQVAWRLDCCKKHGAWFKDDTKLVPGKPWTKDTDGSFFENLYAKCGECYPSGLVAQYKGVHDYQLLWHKNVPPAQLWAYDKMCKELGGVQF
jgi:hypothetical protein